LLPVDRPGEDFVLVTFHPVEFVERILTRLPGADWQVEHEVVKREKDDLKEDGVGTIDEITSRSNDDGAAAAVERDVIPPSSSAWSSGTFRPDES